MLKIKVPRFTQEQLTNAFIAVVSLSMIIGCIFWHPILVFVWCVVLHRTEGC